MAVQIFFWVFGISGIVFHSLKIIYHGRPRYEYNLAMFVYSSLCLVISIGFGIKCVEIVRKDELFQENCPEFWNRWLRFIFYESFILIFYCISVIVVYSNLIRFCSKISHLKKD